MSRRSRGVTLLEMLIVIFVMGVMTTALFFILVAGKSAYLVSDTDVAMHNKLARVLNEMWLECKHSDPNYLTIGTSPTSLGFYTNATSDATYAFDDYGNPAFKRLVVYYLQANTKYLRKREIDGTFSTALTTSQLRAYCNGSGRVMADDITGLTVRTYGPSFSSSSVWGFYVVLNTTMTSDTGDTSMGGRQMYAAPWY